MDLASLTGSGQMSGTLLGVMVGFNEVQDLPCNPLHDVMIFLTITSAYNSLLPLWIICLSRSNAHAVRRILILPQILHRSG